MNHTNHLTPFPQLSIGESGDYCGFQITRISRKLYKYSGNPRLEYSKACIVAIVDTRPINRRD